MNVFWSVLPERAILEKPFIYFMRLAEYCGQLGYHYIPLNRMRTDTAREAVCAEFKRLTQNPEDVLVQLDADHIHPFDIVERLAKDDKPIVAALAFRGDPTNPTPCFWLKDKNGLPYNPRTWEKGVIQVSITGSGAIAIKRGVFDKLDKAGFDKMYWFYQYPENGMRVSDEIAINQMAEECGIPVFVDTTLVTPHCSEAYITEDSWREWCADHPVVNREHRVSVIIPQKGRLPQLKKAIDSLLATAPNVECIVMLDSGDSESGDFLANSYGMYKNVVWYFEIDKRPIDKWNHGAEIATGDVIVAAANDVEFGDKWLDYALEALDSVPDGNAMVAFNDTVTTPEVSSPHFLMSREYIVKYNGGVLMPPVYKKQFPDVENRLRAQSLGRYVCAKASIVKHLHPLTNTATMDDIHREGLDTFEEDQKLCAERQKQDFPIVWEATVK